MYSSVFALVAAFAARAAVRMFTASEGLNWV
jgi:hypothetical protein